MSTWGFESYYEKRKPIIATIIENHEPKFILANHPALRLHTTEAGPPDRLMSQDLGVLQRNYVHHWGPVYVAGKKLDLKSAFDHRRVHVAIPGTYTLEADVAVWIDGIRHSPGAVVSLPKGQVLVAATEGRTSVTLRWGDKLRVPEDPPPDARILFPLIVR